MGEKLPRLTARQIVKVLGKLGFREVRSSGSHRIYRSESGLRATVPFHSKIILHPKIIKTILQDSDLTVKRLKELL